MTFVDQDVNSLGQNIRVTRKTIKPVTGKSFKPESESKRRIRVMRLPAVFNAQNTTLNEILFFMYVRKVTLVIHRR